VKGLPVAGGEKLMLADPFPAVTTTFCGALGTCKGVTGVTGLEAAEATLDPRELEAFTVKV
jgi:hypothetical protein